MAKTPTPAFTQSISHSLTAFLPADSTNLKTIATAGANDSQISSLLISNTDTISNIAFFYIDNGTTNALISHCVIPANSGTNGSTDIVSVLNSSTFYSRKLDSNANPYLLLGANHTLKMKLNTAVSATKEIDVLCTLENY